MSLTAYLVSGVSFLVIFGLLLRGVYHAGFNDGWSAAKNQQKLRDLIREKDQ